MITYPRKCIKCEYRSNNPAMFHFHKQTHEPIPQNSICVLGCNQPAKFRKTNGNLVCSENSHQCPAYRLKHSHRIKKQWKENKWIERRKRTATLLNRLTPEQINRHKQAGIETKRQKRIAIETSTGQRVYSRAVIYHSRKTYYKNKKILNPENLSIGRGKGKYGIDHRVSRHVGWLLKIPVETMSSVHNLQILSMQENSSKSIKCSLKPEELLRLAQ